MSEYGMKAGHGAGGQMDLGISGKVAVVAGAGQGIGRATAKILAQWGAKIAAVDLDQTALAAAVAEIRGLGHEAEPYIADVCMEEQVVNLFKDVSKKYSRIDILVNVVGGGGEASSQRLHPLNGTPCLNLTSKQPSCAPGKCCTTWQAVEADGSSTSLRSRAGRAV